MGHNTPPPVIPALVGVFRGKGATIEEVCFTNNLFE
jgi:hypothetical protein